METKELGVFVVNADNPDLDDQVFAGMSGYSIDNWSDTPDGDELEPDAMRFIEIAEQLGSVYSIKGFMVAFNITEDICYNDYVFITNKY